MSHPSASGGWQDPYQPPADPYAAPAGGAPPPGARPTDPPPGYPPPGYPPPGYPAPGRTNGMAIAALVVSLSGLPPVGAILGHIARRQIRERGEEGDGMALAGIIVGWVLTGLMCGFCGLYLAFFSISVGGSSL